MSGLTSPAAVNATGIGRVFQAKGGPITALDGIDLRIEPGELLGCSARMARERAR